MAEPAAAKNPDATAAAVRSQAARSGDTIFAVGGSRWSAGNASFRRRWWPSCGARGSKAVAGACGPSPQSSYPLCLRIPRAAYPAAGGDCRVRMTNPPCRSLFTATTVQHARAAAGVGAPPPFEGRAKCMQPVTVHPPLKSVRGAARAGRGRSGDLLYRTRCAALPVEFDCAHWRDEADSGRKITHGSRSCRYK